MRFVNYKIFAGLILIAILLLLLKNTTSNILELQQNGSIVQRLSEELSQAKQKNSYLTERLKVVQTDRFIEEEAREKLGYVRGNEVLIQDSVANPKQEMEKTAIREPNWKQWVNLFF